MELARHQACGLKRQHRLRPAAARAALPAKGHASGILGLLLQFAYEDCKRRDLVGSEKRCPFPDARRAQGQLGRGAMHVGNVVGGCQHLVHRQKGK